jgi:type II secretory pathway component PulF
MNFAAGNRQNPSLDERVTFFDGLARCLQRNISTIKSLQLIAGRMRSPRYCGAIADISQEIIRRDKFGDAMAKHPDLFNEEILTFVRAGEESGRLPDIFHQIPNTKKKDGANFEQAALGHDLPCDRFGNGRPRNYRDKLHAHPRHFQTLRLDECRTA